MKPIEQKAITNIRFLAAEAVQKANSGHPGLPIGAAPMAFALWRQMKHDPKTPKWQGRDRFVLSAGHASMLEYSLLHLFGYGLPMEELKDFRQWGSKTPGHPELGHTVGVETTTGPLGQGIATAVGMAMAEARLCRAVQPRRLPGCRQLHLRAERRRLPDGGRRFRGRVACGASQTRQADSSLRPQPDYD